LTSTESTPQPATPSRSRGRLVAILLLLVCFGAGFLAGMLFDRAMLIHQSRMLPRGGIEFATRHLAHRLDRQLDLTPEQEAQVRAILERRKQKVFAEWDGLHGRLHREIEDAHREIAEILTPEQRAKFDRMQWRWRKRGARERVSERARERKSE
jgi:Spy/CpxP family protein refolding chaperone